MGDEAYRGATNLFVISSIGKGKSVANRSGWRSTKGPRACIFADDAWREMKKGQGLEAEYPADLLVTAGDLWLWKQIFPTYCRYLPKASPLVAQDTTFIALRLFSQ
jgi:hypothetical protein